MVVDQEVFDRSEATYKSGVFEKFVGQFIKRGDRGTYYHLSRLIPLGIWLGFNVGLPETSLEKFIEKIETHDQGKLGIPLQIINESDSATFGKYGWPFLKMHPERGYHDLQQRLLDGNTFGAQYLEEDGYGALFHHFTVRDNPYPLKLRNLTPTQPMYDLLNKDLKFQIGLLSAIDGMETATSNRYRKPISAEEAISSTIKRYKGENEEKIVKGLERFKDKYMFDEINEFVSSLKLAGPSFVPKAKTSYSGTQLYSP